MPAGSPLHLQSPVPTQQVHHFTEPPLPTLLTTKPPITTRKLIRRGKLVKSHIKPRKYCGNLVNGHMMVNTKMRALNLERKLKKAGGLDSWLVSLGLGQFVNIFRCKRVGKLELVKLTMKKLKDMGALAVGPRRKLMHAIDCLW
ncbi:hypothetical protein L2E82_35653 [Cichorium intybus]|uniref:Uncharacterized protein n=1 Tax=Cichorium intybus TaxID=13427 RepID=A0ACB9BPC9_CICIN|nr:hypothetical protein L2E82_35653 [Cichorium intybus]